MICGGEANARLIAAAPELLTMLKRVNIQLANCQQILKREKGDRYSGQQTKNVQVWTEAEAAIAKATQ